MAQYLGNMAATSNPIADTINKFADQIAQRKQQNQALALEAIKSGMYAPGGQPQNQGFLGAIANAMNGPQVGGSNMNLGGMNYQYVTPEMRAQQQAQGLKSQTDALRSSGLLGTSGSGTPDMQPKISMKDGQLEVSMEPVNPNQAKESHHLDLENQILENRLLQDPQYQNQLLEKRQTDLDKAKTELEMDKQKLSAMNKVNPQDVRFKQEDIDLRAKQIEAEQLKINQMKQQIDANNNTTQGMDLNKTPQELQQDFSKKNPSYARYLKMLADGKMTLGGRSTKQMMQVQKDLATLYPDMDMSKIQARYQTRKDFTTGTAAKNIKSLNTAVNHLSEMSKIIPRLGNSSFRLGNTVANWKKREFGDPAIVRFNAIKDALSGELASIYKNNGATQEEINNIKSSLDSSDSPEQLKAALDEGMTLMNGRLMALQDQWHNAFDRQDDTDFPVISTRSKQILKGMGFDEGQSKADDQTQQSPTQTKNYVKTGMYNGRKVGQLADGTVEYLDGQ